MQICGLVHASTLVCDFADFFFSDIYRGKNMASQIGKIVAGQIRPTLATFVWSTYHVE